MSMSPQKSVAIPEDFVLVSATTVASDTTLSTLTARPIRGLLVGTAGYLDVTMLNGEERDGVPFQAGINPGAFKIVRESVAVGAAANVWAIV